MDNGEECSRCNNKTVEGKYYCAICEAYGHDEFEECIRCEIVHLKAEGDLCQDCKETVFSQKVI